MGIESVVHQSSGKVSGGIRDAMCPACEMAVMWMQSKVSSGILDAMCPGCEMAVVWMQNQLKQNQTQDRILNYVNEVEYA
jgi:endogenous inhibitor of DNA gyrase (YacG/DUF329 family)